MLLYVTLDSETCHKIYTSSESWINKLSIDVWFVEIFVTLDNKTSLKFQFFEIEIYT